MVLTQDQVSVGRAEKPQMALNKKKKGCWTHNKRLCMRTAACHDKVEPAYGLENK